MALEYILIIFLIISVIISFGIGANDETMAPLYGSRILNMKQILVLAVSSALGLPISSTHATIGGIIGLGLLLGGGDGVNWSSILNMSMWWIASPIVGFTVTYGVVKLLNKHKLKSLNGFQDFERSENKYSYIILIIICITAFSRAGNDCSNAVGIVVGVGDEINITLLLIITGFGLAAGVSVLGRIVIKNLGKMTELRPSTAFAVQVRLFQ
ncbi:MAG: inorganic phosphate transporter [Promethearchaeota archaeon]